MIDFLLSKDVLGDNNMGRYKRRIVFIGMLVLIYNRYLYAENIGQLLEKRSEIVNNNNTSKLERTLTSLSVDESGLLHDKVIKNQKKIIPTNKAKRSQGHIGINDATSIKIKKTSENKEGGASIVSNNQTSLINAYARNDNRSRPFRDNNRWRVERGSSLFNTLSQWAADAGWSLIWNVDTTYQILSTATFSGDFISAVKQLFSSSGMQYIDVYLNFYTGNKVLLVTSKVSS